MTGQKPVYATLGTVQKPADAPDAAAILFTLFDAADDTVLDTMSVPVPVDIGDGASVTFTGLDTAFSYKVSAVAVDGDGVPTAPALMTDPFTADKAVTVVVAVGLTS